MLIGDKIVFLRLPKASTTSTTAALRAMNLGTFIGGGVSLPMPGYRMPMHAGFSYLPPLLKKRYVFGSVRNPFAGLVSYYHYFMNEQGEGRMGFEPFLYRDSSGEPEFEGTLAKMLYPGEHGLTGQLPFIGHSDGKADIGEWMENLQVGLFSWWYLWVFARDPIALAEEGDRARLLRDHDTLVGQRAMLDSLHVPQGLPAVLRAADIDLDEAQQEIVDDFPHRNVNRTDATEHERGKSSGKAYSGDWRSMHNERTIGWVMDREQLLVQRYGYTPDGGGFSEPIFFEQPEAQMEPYTGPLLRDFFAAQEERSEEFAKE
jgi:hypothetical protein